MSSDDLNIMLRSFRRRLAVIRVLRIALIVLFLLAFIWADQLDEPDDKHMMFLVFAAAVLTWILLVIGSTQTGREVQTASVLLNIGKLDDAEVWLHKAMGRFSLSARGKVIACQQLAALFMRREQYAEVVLICRTLLRRRLCRLHSVWINTRLLLADSLLYMDRVYEAYQAVRPMYDVPLTLADRMKLLPIQLRYELAADQAASAVVALKEKIEIAELLDAPRAALVHALLAEACRRRNMRPQYNFLIERARLYYDLDKLAERYPILTPVVADTNTIVSDLPEGHA
ncbi:MAG: hypothetical protein JSV03_17295 [Planctomycetota bacterium]|nr:MAG: hypothetical protein JSV03_17295 [Planctomycetota bacterium]